MNLILIGYRATGKTTLSVILALRLGWEWLDSDIEIETRKKKSIATIFSEDGEPEFRELEARVIADLCSRDQIVLAAGGGAPLREENRRAMRQKNGKVVWLTARPETILKRMSADTTTIERRPNLTDKSRLEEIVQLLALREPIYREMADLIIDTENRMPHSIATEILDQLELPKK